MFLTTDYNHTEIKIKLHELEFGMNKTLFFETKEKQT